MIFVTVGTTSFPFDRLLRGVDEVMMDLRADMSFPRPPADAMRSALRAGKRESRLSRVVSQGHPLLRPHFVLRNFAGAREWPLKTNEELIVQKGVSLYQFKYGKDKRQFPGLKGQKSRELIKVYGELPFDRMITYLKQARVIITSGGPATIFLALKYGTKKPIVVPRCKRFGEHVDDHEVLFAKFMEEKNQVKTIKPDDNIIKMIVEYLLKPKEILNPIRQAQGKQVQDDKQKLLVKKLIDYTNSLE